MAHFFVLLFCFGRLFILSFYDFGSRTGEIGADNSFALGKEGIPAFPRADNIRFFAAED